MIIFNQKIKETYRADNYPESPDRINRICTTLANNSVPIIESNTPASESSLKQIHTAEHLYRLRNSIQEDPDCPPFPNIYDYATLAAGTALASADATLSGQHSFSLVRPPGHHASEDKSMGFCYINNAALASVYLKSKKVGRVAILDIDNHHGNGTQEIVTGLENILFVDIHSHPDYPETGNKSEGNCINYPLTLQTTEQAYLSALDQGLMNIKRFDPSILVVSAGFDTYKGDPIGKMKLEVTSYFQIAQRLKSLRIPICSILEGGYNTQELPNCILSYISGLQ